MKLDMSKEEFESLLSDREIMRTLNKIDPQIKQYSGQHIHLVRTVMGCVEELSDMVESKEITSKTFGGFKDENSWAYELVMDYFYRAFTKGTYRI